MSNTAYFRRYDTLFVYRIDARVSTVSSVTLPIFMANAIAELGYEQKHVRAPQS